MPQLREHQLRVGGIAKIITNDWTDRVIAEESVISCLLHDMGNIVKFHDLKDKTWMEIQSEYHQKYGTDAHVATIGILKDAGLPKYVDYIEEEKELYEQTPTEQKIFDIYSKPALIVLYADLRVMPSGVVSIEERTEDLIKRYRNKRTENIYGPPTERYIQKLTNTDVSKISESDVRPLFDELLTMTV
jgi:hypothetical protein